MPYRKYRPRRRRKPRRPAPPSMWGCAKQYGYKAYKGLQYLRKLINVEKKHKRVTSGATGVDSAGWVEHLTPIAQGDTFNTREGNSVLGQTNLLRGNVYLGQDATGANLMQIIRIIMVRDKQQVSDTPPAVTDILQVASVNSPLNIDVAGRFQVLFDMKRHVHYSSPVISFKKFIPVNKHVRFNGADGQDIQKGGLYLLCLSNNAVDPPTVSFDNRFSYTDN